MDDTLLEAGLTRSEIAVYHSLIELGSTTTGPLVKEAKISSGKIYEILTKLIEKGLATYIYKGGRRFYQPTSPERLVDFVNAKQEALKKVQEKVKEVAKVFEARSKERFDQQAEVFEGAQGFKAYCEFCLKKITRKTDYSVLGVSSDVNEKFGGYLLDWQKRRSKKGVLMRLIYNADAEQYGKLRKALPYTQVRYLPKGMYTPALIEIFDDYVATVLVLPKPVIFMIKNSKAAESYMKYFEVMWALSRP